MKKWNRKEEQNAARDLTIKLLGRFYVLEYTNVNNWESDFKPLVIYPNLYECEEKLKDLHEEGYFGYDVKNCSFRIRSFLMNELSDEWRTEALNLENTLVQERGYRTLNSKPLIEEVNQKLKDKNCLSTGLFYGNPLVDCFQNRRDLRYKERFCTVHKCTSTNCNCSELVEQIYEELEHSISGGSVFYTHPKIIEKTKGRK